MKKIVLATANTHKIREYQAMLAPLDIEVLPQSAFHLEEAEETGLSFVENAIIKARHATRLTGLPALADDSGLAVAALNGAPGIYSSRYAGLPSNDEKNRQKLLDNLDSIADDQREACFHCVLVLMTHALDPTPLICHGKWSGNILRSPRGTKGFGYDPVFYVPDEKMSAAELPAEKKNMISHRGLALQSLLNLLDK